ncbi:MAG: TIGR04076 family protein [Candidatus Bathyarchaeota archaeon]|nr:TIGR04076 family protein [Candidatus Bathyarchaeota archaeon]
MKSCRLVGKVVKVQGECIAGHHVGEEFDFTLFSEKREIHKTPQVCGFLYHSLFPYLVTLQFGGSFPWEKDKNKFIAGCPDNYKVVVKIRRVEE